MQLAIIDFHLARFDNFLKDVKSDLRTSAPNFVLMIKFRIHTDLHFYNFGFLVKFRLYANFHRYSDRHLNTVGWILFDLADITSAPWRHTVAMIIIFLILGLKI